MPTIYLVRHAKPAATWGEATDPGLDATGIAQAEQTAKELHTELPRIALYTSPMNRCKETAAPLAKLWAVEPTLFSAVAEIPSPPLSGHDKAKWLQAGMQGDWDQLQSSAPMGSPDFSAWRKTLLDTLRSLEHDAVIYSHYIAINVVAGAAQGHDRVISFRPGHASITKVAIQNGRFTVLSYGADADGGILLGK
jgi:broad specificity phosphatase PhoE